MQSYIIIVELHWREHEYNDANIIQRILAMLYLGSRVSAAGLHLASDPDFHLTMLILK